MPDSNKITRTSLGFEEAMQRYTLGGHIREHHADVTINKKPMFIVRILAIESNVTTRKAREAIEIWDRRPAVNRNRDWLLD